MLNMNKSSSGNFQALTNMANNETTFEVNVSDEITYKDETGNIQTQSLGNITQGDPPDAVPFSPKTVEMGWLGVTQTPGNEKDKYNSTDDKVRIAINKNLSEKGKTENFAHEGYGHGYLQSKGQEHKHKVKMIDGKMIETNKALAKQIIERINETVKNLNSK